MEKVRIGKTDVKSTPCVLAEASAGSGGFPQRKHDVKDLTVLIRS
jgi:hypothetical protein